MKRIFHTYLVLFVASIFFGFLLAYGCGGGETTEAADTTEETEVTDGDTTDQDGVDQGIDFNVDKVEIVLLNGDVIDAELAMPFPPTIKSVRITFSLVDQATASMSKQIGDEELKTLADELVTILYDGVEVGFTSSWASETALDFVLEKPAKHGTKNKVVVKEKDGENVKKEVEYSTSTYHDVNGDGISDMLFGASGIGKAYLVYGGAVLRDIGANVAVSDYTDKVELSGQGINSFSHTRTLLDFDADGYFDVIIAAPFASSVNGEINIFYGSSSMPSPLDAGTAIKIAGEDSGMVGTSMATGDVNGDGLDDLLIGAPGIGGSAVENVNGIVYIFFAGEDPVPGPVSEADLVIKGRDTATGGNFMGLSLETGDVNGDGKVDIMVGARGGSTSRIGEVYVFLGPIEEDIDLSQAGVEPDMTIRGHIAQPTMTSLFGIAISEVGDLNGDGLNDLVIGDIRGTDGLDIKGAIYVFYSDKDMSFPAVITSKDDADVTFFGTSEEEFFGVSITAMNDFDDINSVGFAFGVPFYSAGLSYVGKVEIKVAPTLQTLEQIIGEKGSAYIGGSLESQKDVDGDGYKDLLIGSSIWDLDPPTINNNGKIYIYFGSGSDPFKDHVSFIGPENSYLFLDNPNFEWGPPY